MRGTNAAQDSVGNRWNVTLQRAISQSVVLTGFQRFKDKEAISIKSTKFPKNFSEKVGQSVTQSAPADGLVRSICARLTCRC